MLQFILGTLFGGFVTFVIIAIVSINKTDDEKNIPQPRSTETGDNDARNK